MSGRPATGNKSGINGAAAALVDGLRAVLGPSGLMTDPAAALVYAHDASHLELGRPLAVALPATVAELRRVMSLCAAMRVPVVTRGSGTGLSGGAVPADGSVVLGTGRLQALGTVDRRRGRIQAAAGVLNERVSTVTRAAGFHFAPDPSSQSAATIGGNIATNAGGPHCLRHGVTLHHLGRLSWIDSQGVQHDTGHGTAGERGLDLRSLLCGSEGTLGVIVGAELELVPNPRALVTLLAFFPELDDATGAVVELLGEGLLPVAVEMVDQGMLRAVEEAFAFGFPTDVAVAMIVEFAGSEDAVDEDGRRAGALLDAAGAREVRRAEDAAERSALWLCRKKAFGAVGRLAPSYVTMDVVVPLGHLPGLVREIQVIKRRHGVEIATAFHAGDGNLHPGIHYDDRDPDASRRAHAAADEIIGAALARGGSSTGEHGVGIEKLHALPWQLDAVTARLHRDIKRACDPADLLNPGKAVPGAEARYADLKPVPPELTFQWDSLSVTAPAGCRLSAIQDAAMAHGLWLPLGVPGRGREPGLAHDPTVAELLDHLAVGPSLLGTGTPRDYLLESWAETGGGEVFHSGVPVFKNVAGYALHHMLCGSGGVFVRHLAATFQLRPRPEQVLLLRLSPGAGEPAVPDAFWQWLAARRGRLAAPQVIAAADGSLLLLVAGRDRPWDLGGVAGELTELLGPPAWRVKLLAAVPFATAATLLSSGELPAWSLGASDWTALAPLAGADFLPAAPLPTGFIRQGRPDRLWVPQQVPAAAGWQADPVISAGLVSGLPAPAPGVPRELLGRLKQIFDPHRQLPTPSWLAEVVSDE